MINIGKAFGVDLFADTDDKKIGDLVIAYYEGLLKERELRSQLATEKEAREFLFPQT